MMTKQCCVISLTFLIALLFNQEIAARPVSDQGSDSQGFHGEGHDALHHWYETLRDWKGRPCCNMLDCRPTQSRYRGRNVEVLLNGEWTVVPPHKILPQSSPDLRSHVCSPGPDSNYPRGFIFCVVLGFGV